MMQTTRRCAFARLTGQATGVRVPLPILERVLLDGVQREALAQLPKALQLVLDGHTLGPGLEDDVKNPPELTARARSEGRGVCKASAYARAGTGAHRRASARGGAARTS